MNKIKLIKKKFPAKSDWVGLAQPGPPLDPPLLLPTLSVVLDTITVKKVVQVILLDRLKRWNFNQGVSECRVTKSQLV